MVLSLQLLACLLFLSIQNNYTSKTQKQQPLVANEGQCWRIDFMRDIAYIRIFYYPNGPVSNPIESSDSQSDD
jgi:hypothetical protein